LLSAFISIGDSHHPAGLFTPTLALALSSHRYIGLVPAYRDNALPLFTLGIRNGSPPSVTECLSKLVHNQPLVLGKFFSTYPPRVSLSWTLQFRWVLQPYALSLTGVAPVCGSFPCSNPYGRSHKHPSG
jgi:hypothetical protein